MSKSIFNIPESFFRNNSPKPKTFQFIDSFAKKSLDRKTLITISRYRVPINEMKIMFSKPMSMLYILASEKEKLEIYYFLAKKYNLLHKIRVSYDELIKYRQLCSCEDCFPPTVKFAIDKGLVNIKKSYWKKTWGNGQYL